MATDIKLKDFILYNCTSIKKELKKKGLIILNVVDNIKWKLGVLQFHSAYTRAATDFSIVFENAASNKVIIINYWN
jgi:hypothetical protein